MGYNLWILKEKQKKNALAPTEPLNLMNNSWNDDKIIEAVFFTPKSVIKPSSYANILVHLSV